MINTATATLNHSLRVRTELRDAGVSRYGFARFDIRHLPTIISPDEHISAVVYGLSEGNSMLLAATDRRIIYLNKKPLFIDQDDITYDVVGGISFGHAGLGTTVTLHTRIRDYKVRTFNRKAAQNFVQFIELHCLKPLSRGQYRD